MQGFVFLYILGIIYANLRVFLFSECQPCRSGQKVANMCESDGSNPTTCQPCPPNSFNDHDFHYFSSCKACQHNCADPRMVIIKNCSAEHDIICECTQGFYKIEYLEGCQPCNTCKGDEEIIANCSSSSDIECKKCSDGYFKNNNTYSRCMKHRNCTEYNLLYESNGTKTSDAICGKPIVGKCPNSSSHLENEILWIILIAVFLLLGCILVFIFCIKKSGKKISCLESQPLTSPAQSSTSSNDSGFNLIDDFEVDAPLDKDEKREIDLEFEEAVQKVREIEKINPGIEDKVLAKIKNDMQDIIDLNSLSKFGRILELSNIDIDIAVKKEKEALPEMLHIWFGDNGDFTLLDKKFFELSKRTSDKYRKFFIKRFSEVIDVNQPHISTIV